jgi:hypothetical protein
MKRPLSIIFPRTLEETLSVTSAWLCSWEWVIHLFVISTGVAHIDGDLTDISLATTCKCWLNLLVVSNVLSNYIFGKQFIDMTSWSAFIIWELFSALLLEMTWVVMSWESFKPPILEKGSFFYSFFFCFFFHECYMKRFKLLLPAHFIVHAYSTIHKEERLPEITLRVEISLHPWLTTDV